MNQLEMDDLSSFIVFGIAIELIQLVLAYHSGDLYDGYANTLGILVGWRVGAFIHNRLRSD